MPSIPHHFFENLQSLIESIPPDSIVSRTVHADEQVRDTLFGFAAG